MAEFGQFSLCNTRESLDCPALGLLLFVVSGGLSQPRLFGPLPHCCLHRTDTSLGASLSQWILLTIILLGEFVASVMRGIESQMGWSFLAASAAVLSLALGFALWSCYSDGATGWETRHMRTNKHVVQLRIWIALHFLLFLGIGILGVGARHGIALPPGGSFGATEQWLICFAGAGIMLVIMGIAATSERHISTRNGWVWLAQVAIAIFILSLGLLASRIIATALLLVLFFCFVGQTALLLINQRAHRRTAEI